ncbi:MAG: rhomboid family intramembrane serine protease [Aeromicrobium sp.]
MSDATTEHSPLSRPATAGVLAASYVALLYVVELLDLVLPGRFDDNGVHPRSVDGLDGIIFAPLLHGGWAHLIGNTVPLLVLGFLVGLSGVRTWLQVTAIVWVAGGLGVWLFGGATTNHIGASGVVFGWLSYLIVRGVFNRSLPQIALGVIVFAVYGGVLWGVLPGRPGISWEGHLFGAIAGALAAWLLAPRDEEPVTS